MSMSNSKDKVSVPAWLGNHPFPPEKKKPVLIRTEDEISTIYGLPHHQVSSQVYVSTDKLTFSDFTVPPGNYFLPPDIHVGDEIYYVLKGTATCFCPDTGTTFEANEGDGIYIPKGAWHQVFNFTHKEVTIICVIAPQNWSADDDMGAAVKYSGEAVFYKAGREKKALPDSQLNLLGKWPLGGATSSAKSGIIHVPADKMLRLIHGQENYILVSFIASTELVHMGIMTIPVDKFSDPEVHEGDEALAVLDGILMLRIYGEGDNNSVSQVAPRVQKGEKFLIPAGVKHQYFNLSDELLKILFTVAPEL